jgi:hypothetical protein
MLGGLVTYIRAPKATRINGSTERCNTCHRTLAIVGDQHKPAVIVVIVVWLATNQRPTSDTCS